MHVQIMDYAGTVSAFSGFQMYIHSSGSTIETVLSWPLYTGVHISQGPD